MRGNRASRAPKPFLNLCNLVATTNEPVGLFFLSEFCCCGRTRYIRFSSDSWGNGSASLHQKRGVRIGVTRGCVSWFPLQRPSKALCTSWPSAAPAIAILPGAPCPSLPAPPSPPQNPLHWVPCTESGAFWVMLHQTVTAAWSRLECLAPNLKRRHCF